MFQSFFAIVSKLNKTNYNICMTVFHKLKHHCTVSVCPCKEKILFYFRPPLVILSSPILMYGPPAIPGVVPLPLPRESLW